MALWQDAEIIAAFAALGAFITPLALSTGVNNAAGLFSYLFILDVGALILIRYRPWPRVLMGSYLGTLILYSSWHSSFYSVDQFSTGLMLVGFWNESRFIRWQALILIGATVFKVFLYDTSSLDRGYRILSFITLGLILLATSFLYQRSSRAERSG